MTGHVTLDGEPIILIEVSGRQWSAIIDTGFNGDLQLPNALRSATNPRRRGTVLSLLAGGTSILEEVFEVQFPFDGRIVLADATFVVGGDLLIGTHLIRSYRLIIEFVAQTVELDQIV